VTLCTPVVLNNVTNSSKVTESDGKNFSDTRFSSCQKCNESTTPSAASNETRYFMVGPPSIEKAKSVWAEDEVLNFTGSISLGVPPIGAPVALDAQNAYRVAVGEVPLVWSATLASSAQAWAQHLADTNTFMHSCPGGGCSYGENLAAGWPSSSVSDTLLVNAWGNERQYFKCGTFPDVSTTGN
jgi:hypothetical protein